MRRESREKLLKCLKLLGWWCKLCVFFSFEFTTRIVFTWGRSVATQRVDPLPSNYGMHSQLQGAAQNNASRLWSLVAATSGRTGKTARAHRSSPFKIEKKKKPKRQPNMRDDENWRHANEQIFLYFLLHSFPFFPLLYYYYLKILFQTHRITIINLFMLISINLNVSWYLDLNKKRVIIPCQNKK